MGASFTGAEQFTRRVQDLAKRGKDAISQTVAVGVLGKTDSDLVVIAAANEYGAIAGNGAVIPARPFMRPSMRSDALKKFVRETIAAYYQGKYDLPTALGRIGLFASSLVKKTIGSNIPPPNAPSTIAKKQSSRTLIDTGRLRQSISWEIVQKRGRS